MEHTVQRRSKTNASGGPADVLSHSSNSMDIQTHQQQQQTKKLNQIFDKLSEIEINRNDDKNHIISLEKGIVSLQKSTNRVQQQQFDQTSMLKQCITDLSTSMQRLTNEVVFMKNKIKKMENQINLQDSRMNDMENINHQHSIITDKQK